MINARSSLPLWVRSVIGYVVASYLVCGIFFLRGEAPHGNDGIFVFAWLLSPLVVPFSYLPVLAKARLSELIELSWPIGSFVAIWLVVQVLLGTRMFRGGSSIESNHTD
jgi:hypothetical protein